MYAHRGEYDRKTPEQILVRDAMTPWEAIITLSPTDESLKVPDLIATSGHTGFPVPDDGRLVGIITNRDTRTLLAAEGIMPSVREAMTPHLTVIYPEDSLEDALEIMVRRDFNHLPVVEKGSPDRLTGFLDEDRYDESIYRTSRQPGEWMR